MLSRLIGDTSLPAALKLGLDASTRAVRGIGHRISNASTPGGSTFQDALQREQAVDAPVDVERGMVALADEQLRFEATSRLLQRAYSQIRSSIREG